MVAVIGSVVPFFLINWGETTLDSSLTGILMATMPLATMVLAHFFTADDRMTAAKGAGMVVGFVGIVILVGPGALGGLGQEVTAQVAVMAAGCCYAISAIYTRRSGLRQLSALTTGTGVLICATLVSLPLALAIDKPWV